LFDASLDTQKKLQSSLNPIRTKKIEIHKKLIEKQNDEWVFTNKEAKLELNEEAYVTLRRISPIEEDFTSVVGIRGNENKELQIAPGMYELQINMFLRDSLNIPERVITKQTGLFTQEQIKIPGMLFSADNPFPSGGVRMNITLTEADLAKDTLVLYAISPALQFVPEALRSIQDLEEVSKIDHYSRIFAPLLKPKTQ